MCSGETSIGAEGAQAPPTQIKVNLFHKMLYCVLFFELEFYESIQMFVFFYKL